MKKDSTKNTKKKSASTPEFNIKDYPQIEWPNKKTGKVDKYYILPDDIFEEHLKELPNGTFNESKQYRAFNGGKLYQIGSNPEKDKEITRKGAEASWATQIQRRTFKDQVDIILARKDKETEKTGVENVVVSMYERAVLGDVKAAQFLRDTAGEKPAETIDLNANARMITPEEEQLLKNYTGHAE